MKNFKNSICVKGTPALCKAFASELEEMGYKFRTKEYYPISVTTYGGEGNYCNLLEGYATYLGDIKCIHMNLPQDWNKALALAAEEVKPVTYSIGDKFSYSKTDCTYLLTQIAAYHVCMVNINEGNRYYDAFQVSNVLKITQEEFDKITDSREFKLIKK